MEDAADQIEELLRQLDTDALDDRLTAIEALGEIGDTAALRALRAQMAILHREYYALIVAVGKLKKNWERGREPSELVTAPRHTRTYGGGR